MAADQSGGAGRLRFLGVLIFLFSLAFYCAGVAKAFQEPIGAEEPWFLYAAEALNAWGTYDALTGRTQVSASSLKPHPGERANYHPPGQVFLIAAVGRAVGDYLIGGRILALLCVLLTTAVLFAQAYLIFEQNPHRVFWSCLTVSFFLANPVTIKSSVALFQDPSTYLLALSVFQLAILGVLRTKKTVLFLGVAMAWIFCLFIKMTVTLLVIGSLGIFLLLHFKKISWPALVLMILSFVAAMTVFRFLLAYLGFPGERLFAFAMGYASASISTDPLWTTIRRACTSLLLTALWMSPAMIGLFVWACVMKCSDYLRKQSDLCTDFVLIVAGCFIFGHVLTGGTYGQFPRYMVPGLPGLCLICVWVLSRLADEPLQAASPRTGIWLGILACSFLWYWLGVGDYLYAATFKPRAVFLGRLDGGMKDLAMTCALQMLRYLLPFLILLAVWRRLRKSSAMFSLVSVLITSLWGMDMIQAAASYSTYYGYGETGRWQAIELAKGIPPDRAVMAPFALVYYKDDDVSTYRYERDWYYKDAFWEIVRDPVTEAIVYGVMDAEMPVIRGTLEDAQTKAVLREEGYRESRVGSHTIWSRGKGSKGRRHPHPNLPP